MIVSYVGENRLFEKLYLSGGDRVGVDASRHFNILYASGVWDRGANGGVAAET